MTIWYNNTNWNIGLMALAGQLIFLEPVNVAVSYQATG